MVEVINALEKLYSDYQKTTTSKLKLIDAYMLYILFTGIIQFVYCCLVGTFPFNAFLAGFCSTVASFVLAACLRIQVNPENKDQFPSISPESFRRLHLCPCDSASCCGQLPWLSNVRI